MPSIVDGVPASVLPGRGYDMSVTGPALAMAAAGHAHRHIAAQFDIPADTVRGWLRRLRARADMLISHCTVLAYRLNGSLSRTAPPSGWRSPSA